MFLSHIFGHLLGLREYYKVGTTGFNNFSFLSGILFLHCAFPIIFSKLALHVSLLKSLTCHFSSFLQLWMMARVVQEPARTGGTESWLGSLAMITYKDNFFFFFNRLDNEEGGWLFIVSNRGITNCYDIMQKQKGYRTSCDLVHPHVYNINYPKGNEIIWS